MRRGRGQRGAEAIIRAASLAGGEASVQRGLCVCSSMQGVAPTVTMAGHWTRPLFWGKTLKSSSCRMDPLALHTKGEQGQRKMSDN